MKRYKAYDPPEYHDWVCQPEILEGFRARIGEDASRQAIIEALDGEALVALYRGLLRARLHDIYLKRWVKSGVITKAWLATGEEAVTVGSVHALNRSGEDRDVVGPMIRNAAACIEMGMPLTQLFAAYLGTTDTLTLGRDLHIGDLAYGVVAPVSHTGSLQPVMVGTALAFKMQRKPRVAMTWVGEGSTRTGEFHEGANFAGTARLPVIIFIQNNQVALGTQTSVHTRGDFLALADAYGMPGMKVDGNHVLDVYAATKIAVDRARAGGGPTLIVAETFRMGGHATHDEAEARRLFPQSVFDAWGLRDPIGMFEAWLADTDLGLGGEGASRQARNLELLASVEEAATQEMEVASEEAVAHRTSHQPDPADLLDGLYA